MPDARATEFGPLTTGSNPGLISQHDSLSVSRVTRGPK